MPKYGYKISIVSALTAAVAVTTSCGTPYKEAITEWADEKVCAKLGAHHLYNDQHKVAPLVSEIKDRNMSIDACLAIAATEISRLTPEYKTTRCQFLGQHYAQANYESYKSVQYALDRVGLLDDECIEIANFHIRAMSIAASRRQQFLNSLTDYTPKTPQQPLGSYFNPIHIKIAD